MGRAHPLAPYKPSSTDGGDVERDAQSHPPLFLRRIDAHAPQKLACEALLALASSKGSPAIASGAASVARAAHAPTTLAEAVLVGSPAVADSGAAGDDAPPTKPAALAKTPVTLNDCRARAE